MFRKVKMRMEGGYDERHVLRKGPSIIEVRFKRGQGAEYVQDGKAIDKEKQDLVVKCLSLVEIWAGRQSKSEDFMFPRGGG